MPWKKPFLIPVPKKSRVSALSDYTSAAPMSHITKVLERLFLAHLRRELNAFQDPVQFAHHPRLLGFKKPLYACFSELTLIGTKQLALRGSCSLISSVFVTQSSLNGCVKRSRKYRWLPPQLPQKQTTVGETKRLCVGEAAQETWTMLHTLHST